MFWNRLFIRRPALDKFGREWKACALYEAVELLNCLYLLGFNRHLDQDQLLNKVRFSGCHFERCHTSNGVPYDKSICDSEPFYQLNHIATQIFCLVAGFWGRRETMPTHVYRDQPKFTSQQLDDRIPTSRIGRSSMDKNHRRPERISGLYVGERHASGCIFLNALDHFRRLAPLAAISQT